MNTLRLHSLKRSLLVLGFTVVSVTACQQDNGNVVKPSTNSTAGARASCTVVLNGEGFGFGLGVEPKLAPNSSGLAGFPSTSDCDYFLGFPANDYQYVVVADQGDSGAANAIYSLIQDQPVYLPGTNTIVGGGFANRVEVGSLSGDSRVFLVFGNGRTDNALYDIAQARGTTIRELLAKHVRLGNDID